VREQLNINFSTHRVGKTQADIRKLVFIESTTSYARELLHTDP